MSPLPMLALLLAAPADAAEQPPPPLAERYLLEGRLDDGRAALEKRLEAHPDDEQARFGLGVTRFLGGVERFAGFLHRKGAGSRLSRNLPFLRLPVPRSGDPEPVTYEEWRQARVDLLADLTEAEAVLAEVDGDVHLPLHFARIKLDLNGNGEAEEGETLWRVYAAVNSGGMRAMGGRQFEEVEVVEVEQVEDDVVDEQAVATPVYEDPEVDGELVEVPDERADGETRQQRNERRRAERADRLRRQAEALVIDFDRADVEWLRGYCHLLSASLEMQLAHDASDWFDRCAHLFFAKPQTSFPFLQRSDQVFRFGGDFDVADVIAAVHLVNFEVIEPERMANARDHLKAMVARSRAMWEFALAETDASAERIPNPDQRSVVGVRIEPEMVETWGEFLDQLDALLDGEKLIPFWRDKSRGVNFNKVFAEPERFDLMMWVQGTGAAPFVEEGELVDPATWRRFQQVFRGDFFGFAVWIN